MSKPATFYAYLLIAFSLVILGISMYGLLQALTFYEQGEFTQFFFWAIMSSVGTVLALSSITQMRRRMVILHNLAVKVLSVVICASCGFKVVRSFGVGDYVLKDVGQCQQCKGTMRVDSIYSEEPTSKKT